MALTDYDSLRDELSAWTARNDTKFRNRFDTFLQLAEDRIYNGAGEDGDPLKTEALRSDVMTKTDTITITDGEGTLPSDCIDIRSAHPVDQRCGIDYLPPERFEVAQNTVSGSLPQFYTMLGKTMKVHPAFTGTLRVIYYQRFDAITSDNKTGSLLTAHPGLYLSALLFEAYSWMSEPNEALGHLGRYRSLVAGANNTGRSVRYGAQSLRIRPRQPIS